MNSISNELIEKIILRIPILEGLNDFILRIYDENFTLEIKDLSKNNIKSYDLGIIDKKQNINNISKARQFAFPSSIYGHRYGKNMTAEWDTRSNLDNNVYCTDNEGLLKNSALHENSSKRVMQASKKNIPVIFFFGGSTMMSMGGLIPDFSIPALVENILYEKYKKEVICVNYALGGTCSREALDLYIHDARVLSKTADVIFYDGWNCASYLSQMHRIAQDDNSKNLVSYGDTKATIQHNYVLSNLYSLRWHLTYVFKLCLANIFQAFTFFLPNSLRKFFLSIQTRLLPLSSSQISKKLLKNADETEDSIKNAIENAVNQYIDIHECVRSICNGNNSSFIWIQQPLTCWGKKRLTPNESKWLSSGISTTDIKNLYKFEKKFKDIFKTKTNNHMKEVFHDFTGIFDKIDDELYIDSGHLNRLGNLIVSSHIAKLINDKKNH